MPIIASEKIFFSADKTEKQGSVDKLQDKMYWQFEGLLFTSSKST